jgi:hypothetical protein
MALPLSCKQVMRVRFLLSDNFRSKVGKVMFTFAMTTIKREPEYCFKTLVSFLAADSKVLDYLPLHIYLGSPITDHTDYIKHHNLFDIHNVTWEEWRVVYDASTIQRFCFNLSRCFRTESMRDTTGLILFEDDVKFVDNWFGIFHQILKDYPMLTESIVQLYHCHKFDNTNVFHKIPYEKAFGTQCVFIPRKVLLPVSKLIYQEGVLHPKPGKNCCGDVILAEYCEAQNIAIYGINPPLVQHEGFYSTGLGGGHCGDCKYFTRSETFDKRITDIHQHGYWLNEAQDCHFFDKRLADKIIEICKQGSVVDFGCGPGKYVEYLNEHGFIAEGFDGNPTLHAKNCFMLDLAKPVKLSKQFDWVLCLEVIEHIPVEYEEVILNNLDIHCKKGLILSWAQPGQGGHGHYNERPQPYVLDTMKARGYTIDEDLTTQLRKSGTYHWFQNNVMFFRKADIV